MSTANSPSPEYESLKCAAARIGFSAEALRRKVDSGELPAFRISDKPGSGIRVKRTDVDALLKPVIPDAIYANRA
jgi:excisionase family DNA binding protein